MTSGTIISLHKALTRHVHAPGRVDLISFCNYMIACGVYPSVHVVVSLIPIHPILGFSPANTGREVCITLYGSMISMAMLLTLKEACSWCIACAKTARLCRPAWYCTDNERTCERLRALQLYSFLDLHLSMVLVELEHYLC